MGRRSESGKDMDMPRRASDSDTGKGPGTQSLKLGLRANAAQFALLVAVNALVGGMAGQQQTVLPLLAESEFELTGYSFIFTYVAAFGITKAIANYFAGTLSDKYGRKPVLLIGWLFAVPVPLMLIFAPDWGWVVAANVLLGINQGLTWSTTVVMKIDLVGPAKRGLAMGLNEAAGYGAVAVTSLIAGYLAEQYGLRPAPFLLGLAYTALALLLSGVFVRETRGHAQLEAAQHRPRGDGIHDHLHANLTNRQVAVQTSVKEPALSAASQAGLVNNLNFGLSWGLFPLLFATADLSVSQVSVLFALYPGVWGRRAAGHRGTLGSHWPQAPDHRRDGPSGSGVDADRFMGWVHPLGFRHGAARGWHRDGLSDLAGGGRRCRPPCLARSSRRCLPGLA